jgi:hypothetical protein
MSKDTAKALDRQVKLLRIEEHLIARARLFYLLGFFPGRLSASQMAAVGDHIQRGATLKEAQHKTMDFLNRQLEKLEAKAKRTGKKTSWLKEPSGAGEEVSLGKTLIHWIEHENYFEEALKSDESIRLVALRRFWATVHGLYRSQKVFRRDMPWWKEGL